VSLKLSWKCELIRRMSADITRYYAVIDDLPITITSSNHYSMDRIGWFIHIDDGLTIGKFIDGTLEEAEEALIKFVYSYCDDKIKRAERLRRKFDSMLFVSATG